MKKIVTTRKILLPLFLLSSIILVARVPVFEEKTILEEVIHSFSPGESEGTGQEPPDNSLDEVWDEVQKIAAHNGDDTLSVSGTIRLYDNLDEEGIREKQDFEFQKAGKDQWFHMDMMDRFHLGGTMVLLDHGEKEILIQDETQVDSLLGEMKLLSSKKLLQLLKKDGTTAKISSEGGMQVLHIVPGSMDAVNQYHIYYDPQTYEIKKLKMAYTSFPYQEYLENESHQPVSPAEDATGKTDEAESEKKDAEDMELELNVTEYVIEFSFHTMKRSAEMNFSHNKFYSVRSGEFQFRGEAVGYAINKF